LEALVADPCVTERAVRRPELEVVPPPFLPGALDGEDAADFAACEPDAPVPSAAGCALRDAEDFAAAGPAGWAPALDAAVKGELAGFDAPLDAGAEGVCPEGAGTEGRVSMRSAATGAGPAGPELL
jgi:hypothetical protein